MPIRYDRQKWQKFREGISRLFDDFGEDLNELGEVARDEIVRATLAGIGEDDKPFKPYSKSYKELVESVGGKPGGVVNLRGIFFRENKKTRRISARMRRMGAGRGSFVFVTVAGRTFLAKTKITRPQKGLEDKESEMSVDLIGVEANAETQKVKLTYTPRKEKYMIYHQETRRWFTINRASVKAALVQTLKTLLEARIASLKRTI